ncbi:MULTISPECIES: winged helix-turn-helix transcriptional regulator [unclassified Leisingera]|uniref:winged helix-turn-helix transcriptional regulator n=1 Tax=unclassified Leisingera TaxID=2614906 RepID=UPI0002EDBB9E|nr:MULTISPECIES: helix-turn-helix domain-containing protein [unclassified Leisingera]KIC21909.1 transcriptional regulator [Leisingera sp. ANG-S3]KIC23807.1 transcriptional regulator [Leisingera sp. ANG-M6]KIC50232.1 transcriptional regulator [Leisingera sp. ANG-S]KID07596.1 transcriptional regulator [Leisingera sp. ANG1]
MNAEPPKNFQTTQSGGAFGKRCPMPDIAQLIGGKWKLIILQVLIFQGTKRFGELRRDVEGITQTMLTSQLRALEKDGLVSREIFPEVPPRVEYTATAKAMALTDMFHAMHKWWVLHNSEQAS